MKRLFWAGVVGVGVCLAFYLAYLTIRIQRQSVIDESRPADVIVVLGAAEYSGRPSPVLQGRLDHALELYRRNMAPRLLTTGGAGGDPVFTESTVGRDYLIKRGVPAESIIVEPEGESTVHSTAAVSEIMRRMGLRSAIIVSDGYHIYRVKKMLQAAGLRVYGSPRPSPMQGDPSLWWLYFRQAVGYLLWSIGIPI